MSNVYEESIRSYFFMTPNIIYELDLDVYEIALYSLLKKIAGEKGHIIYSNQKLADMLKIGITKLKEIKKKLASVIPILNRPLIQVTPRKTEFGDSDTDDIKIVNIWDLNDKFFKEKFKGGSHGDGGPFPGDGGVGRDATGGGSPNDHKEDPLKKTQLKKTQLHSPTPQKPRAPESAICGSVSPHEEKNKEIVRTMKEEVPDKTKGLYIFFIGKTACDPKNGIELSLKMPPDDFERLLMKAYGLEFDDGAV